MEHLLLYQDDPKKIGHFYIKLLKALPGWRLVSAENWFESAAKEYKKRDLEVDFPSSGTSSTILTVPLLQRLSLLRNLCEFHMEQPDHFWELLKGRDGESDLRIEPIGKDSLNRRYWVFSDARMYREIKAPKGSSNAATINWDIEDEDNWELVCLTRADYDEFLATGLPSNNKTKDKSLLKLVRDEIIPQVEPILSYQLSQHKKYFRPVASERICLLPRKRSSRLLEKELEEEQRKREQEEEEAVARKAAREREAELAAIYGISAPARETEEKDLSLEREMRAEMRRAKREKELQIKAIEEAFYATYDPNSSEEVAGTKEQPHSEDLDIEDESSTEEVVSIPKSPIKLFLKVKPLAPIMENDQVQSQVQVQLQESKESNNETQAPIQETIQETIQDSRESKDQAPVFNSQVQVQYDPQEQIQVQKSDIENCNEISIVESQDSQNFTMSFSALDSFADAIDTINEPVSVSESKSNDTSHDINITN
jgi:hypothetical protein